MLLFPGVHLVEVLAGGLVGGFEAECRFEALAALLEPALFDALDTVLASLQVLTELMRRLKVNREALKQAVQGGLLLATELADYLVTKGVPFREAHAITGRVARASLDRGRDLTLFSLDELRRFSDRIDKGVFERLTVQAAIDRKDQIGGTARGRVEQRIK